MTLRRGHDRVEYVEEPGGGSPAKLVLGGLALLALVVFLLQNLQEVDVHFLWMDWSTRLIWALLVAAAFGAIAVAAFTTFRRRRGT